MKYFITTRTGKGFGHFRTKREAELYLKKLLGKKLNPRIRKIK